MISNKKYLVFNTEEEGQAFVDDVHVKKNYDTSGGRAYTKVDPFFKGDRVKVLVCGMCHENMTQDQIDSLKTKAELVLMGGLPDPDYDYSDVEVE